MTPPPLLIAVGEMLWTEPPAPEDFPKTFNNQSSEIYKNEKSYQQEKPKVAKKPSLWGLKTSAVFLWLGFVSNLNKIFLIFFCTWCFKAVLTSKWHYPRSRGTALWWCPLMYFIGKSMKVLVGGCSLVDWIKRLYRKGNINGIQLKRISWFLISF